MRPFTELLLLVFFLLPFGVLLAHINGLEFLPAQDVWPFLKSAFVQGVLSGICSVTLGALLAVGLIFVQNERRRHIYEVFFLVPGLVPGIFVVLAVLQLYSLIGVHPMGYLGVVSANIIVSFGLVGVFLSRAICEKVGGFSELAYTEGASRARIWMTVLPLLKRDFLSMFLAVFIFSFLGFSIPLALGGLEAATLEVQIYRKIMAQGAVGEALVLSLLQFGFIAVFAQLVRPKSALRKAVAVNLSFLGSPWFLVTGIFLTTIVLIAPMSHFWAGAAAVFDNHTLVHLLWLGSISTFSVAVTAGGFTLALGSVMVYLWPSAFIGRFFFAYSAPSAVLIGFGFYLLGFRVEGFTAQLAFLGIILGFFFWPSLYRVAFYGSIAGLARQIEVARQMGAGSIEIFKMITWPQMRGAICAMAALAALWAAGDFGISSMLAVNDSTLSLLVKSLISRYHLPEAGFILGILVSVAVLTALVFLGIYRVVDRKPTLSA